MSAKCAAVLLAALMSVSLVSGCATGATATGPTATGAADASTTSGGTGTGTGTGTATGRLPEPDGGNASADPLPRSAPVRLEIPRIGVDTTVMQLGLNSDGTVEVPPIVAHDPAGWYRGSAAPGEVGPSVVLGHVTVGQYGDGVFLHLARLHRGDRVVARLKDGASAVFSVTSVRTVAKAHFPTKAVYGPVDRPELRLITCAGPRGSDGSYRDNVIAYASLSSTTPAASAPSAPSAGR